MMKQNDPDSAAGPRDQFAETVPERTGLSLRDDLLGKIGPRMAIITPPGGGVGNIIGMWFPPPDLGVVAE